jgi:uncharacterized phage protein (TIGR01671 family)
MDRIIKFRGKTDKADLLFPNSKWVYGYLTIAKLHSLHKIHYQLEDCTWVDATVIPDTVGQFTGLYDKNGKGIYEGDILKTPKYWKDIDYWKGNDFRYYYVKWFDMSDCVFYGFHEVQCNLSEEELEEEKHYSGTRVGCNLAGNAHHFEVIGNIRDNSDLITTK